MVSFKRDDRFFNEDDFLQKDGKVQAREGLKTSRQGSSKGGKFSVELKGDDVNNDLCSRHMGLERLSMKRAGCGVLEWNLQKQ